MVGDEQDRSVGQLVRKVDLEAVIVADGLDREAPEVLDHGLDHGAASLASSLGNWARALVRSTLGSSVLSNEREENLAHATTLGAVQLRMRAEGAAEGMVSEFAALHDPGKEIENNCALQGRLHRRAP